MYINGLRNLANGVAGLLSKAWSGEQTKKSAG